VHFTIGEYVLDIAQNAIEAGAREILVEVNENADGTSVVVADDGCGMSDDERARAVDPFFTDGSKHKNRRVGLGIPFLVQAVEQAGGRWSIESQKGEGTKVSFTFPAASIDSPPMGDLPSVFLALLCFPGEHELRIRRSGRRGGYEVSRRELAEAVGGLELGSSLAAVKDFLISQEEE